MICRPKAQGRGIMKEPGLDRNNFRIFLERTGGPRRLLDLASPKEDHCRPQTIAPTPTPPGALAGGKDVADTAEKQMGTCGNF